MAAQLKGQHKKPYQRSLVNILIGFKPTISRDFLNKHIFQEFSETGSLLNRIKGILVYPWYYSAGHSTHFVISLFVYFKVGSIIWHNIDTPLSEDTEARSRKKSLFYNRVCVKHTQLLRIRKFKLPDSQIPYYLIFTLIICGLQGTYVPLWWVRYWQRSMWQWCTLKYIFFLLPHQY